MKNNNEDDKQGNAFSSDHERLCAYVLGELDATETQAMEECLRHDPELRAEKTRLEATIGMVTSACVGEQSLPAEFMAALERVASKPTPPRLPWYHANSVRIAAGMTAIVTGVLGGMALMQEGLAPGDQDVALYVAPPEEPSFADEEFEQEEPMISNEPFAKGSASSPKPRQADSESDLVAQALGIDAQFERSKAGPPESSALKARPSTALVRETKSKGDLEQAEGAVEVYREARTVAEGAVLETVNESPPARVSSKEKSYKGPGDSVALAADRPLVTGAAGGKATLTPGSGSGGPSTPGPSGPGSPGPARKLLGRVSGSAVADPLPRSRRATREHSAGNENTSFGLDLGILDEGDADGDTYHVATEVWERRANTGQDDFFLGNGQRDQALSTKELGERRTRSILDDCVRRPNEKPKDMFFRFWGDHAFELTQLDALSTFGVDVDTASYTLARRYLNEGNLPSKAAIRTEEFVNYFKPDLLAPSEETFAVTTELAPSRFGNPGTAPSQRWLLRVGVRGKEIAREERKPMNLTFVVDTSGSMKEGGRLELVKHSLRLLVSQLNGGDSIAIVGFSKTATLVLPMTSAQNRDVIEGALYGMAPDGGTNAESGLVFGYEVAAAALSSEVHNRVVLLSDGVANIGQTDQDRINDSVRKRRESGIYLNTIGVGMSNHNDAFLEQLANKGDGLCNYVDSPAEARRALVENFTGAFQPIARDVKIQAEFDPSQVYCYRLLGYENRAIADADFRNDAVDAGEVGAGHQVVALYELELTGAKSEQPLAQIRLRWKAPSGAGRNALEDSATERSFPVLLSTATNWAGSTPGYRRSTLVAQFAEILRRSRHAKGDSLDELIAESELLNPIMNDPDFTEFLGLLKTSRELILRHLPVENDLSNCIDSLRRNRILRAQLEELRRTENKTVLNELEQQNAQLEAKIRDLIQSEVENRVR